jgi:hypothetical protein
MTEEEALQIVRDAFSGIDFQKVRQAYACLAKNHVLDLAHQGQFLQALGTIQDVMNSFRLLDQIRR